MVKRAFEIEQMVLGKRAEIGCSVKAHTDWPIEDLAAHIWDRSPVGMIYWTV